MTNPLFEQIQVGCEVRFTWLGPNGNEPVGNVPGFGMTVVGTGKEGTWYEVRDYSPVDDINIRIALGNFDEGPWTLHTVQAADMPIVIGPEVNDPAHFIVTDMGGGVNYMLTTPDDDGYNEIEMVPATTPDAGPGTFFLAWYRQSSSAHFLLEAREPKRLR